MNFKKTLLVYICGVSLLLSACSNVPEESLVPPNDISIVPREYKKVTVKKGSFTNNIKIELKATDYTNKDYRYDAGDFEKYSSVYNLKFKRLLVDVGDYVKPGDKLIEFTSDEIDKKVEEVSTHINELSSSLEYLRKLSSVDKSANYASTIQDTENEIKLQKVILEETKSTLDDVALKADTEGVVYKLGEAIQNGVFTTNETIASVCLNKGIYTAETDIFDIDTYIKANQVYKARGNKGEEYDVTCTKIEKDASTGVTKLQFVMDQMTASASGGQFVNIVFDNIHLNDVLYVDSAVIVSSKTSGKFVYVLDPDGILRAVDIETAAVVDDVTVIQSGLKEGDEVVVP